MSLAKNYLLLFLLFLCIQPAKADWTKQNSNTFAWLQDVYFTNEQTGWIGGRGGAFLTTTDGGKTWTKRKNFIEDNIRQIYFTDAQTGWLLCERDLFSLGANSPSYLLKTRDAGVSWERIEFPDNQRKRITKFFFAKNGFGLAIGEGGAFFAMQDDGKTWKRIASPVHYLMFDGLFTDDSHGVIVGAGGSILFTEDAGLSWNRASILGNSATKLNSVFFLNQKNGWTVGSQGAIFQTINGGKTWREQKSTVTKNLTDVFFNNSAEGWAVGEEGTILFTATAGNVWTTVNTKAKHKLEKVFLIGKKGFAVGFGGTILSYDENEKKADSPLPPPQLRTRN
jgi:photosystem II stability/assembly factor-like uncharacterized protein